MKFSTKRLTMLYLFALFAGTLFFIPDIFVNRFSTAPALWMHAGIAVGALCLVVVKEKRMFLPPRTFLCVLLPWLACYLWRGGIKVESAVLVAACCLAFLLFYNIFAHNKNRSMLFVACTAAAAALCAWCAGQLLGRLPGYHNQFVITGPFDNPAGISAALAVVLPFVLHEAEKNKKWARFMCAAIAAAAITCIVLSQARAAMIAAGCAVLAYAAQWLKSTTGIKFSPVRCFFAALAMVSLFTALYFLKKDSADGRILIWKCSGKLIAQKPLFGYGTNGFTANYMNAQADYFTRNPNSKYAMLADNIRHPFNEYVKTLVEHGIAGGFLIAFLLLYPLHSSRKSRSPQLRAVRLSFAAMAICALFSYPLNYPFVRLMAIVLPAFLLACGNGGKIWSTAGSSVAKGMVLLFSSGLLAATAYEAFNEREWHKTAHKSLRGETRRMLPRYEKLYARLHRNELFLYNYAAELNVAERYDESLRIARECGSIWADYDLQMLMADNCTRLRQYKEAESYLKQAAAMCPVKFMPLYRLTELYRETGQKEKAIVLAQQIVEKDVKIQSPVINSIKNNMRDFVNKTDNSTNLQQPTP